MSKRKDGVLVTETDPMHALMPYIMKNRADNEAVLDETLDLTAVKAYIDEKNASEPNFKYTFFHVICAAIAKTIYLRPKMNRFYLGYRLYQRNEISLSFVVKRRFEDDSDEVLAVVKIDEKSDMPPIEQIHSQVEKIVYSFRKEKKTDGATDAMGILTKLPRPILRFTMDFLAFLDYHGHYPDVLMKVDPYYTTVFISNLGSIKMNANYHHLANWGTNSIFAVVGEKKPTPFFDADGGCTMRDALNLGITLDERIADGYYFAGTIAILKKLVENPKLLDRPLSEPIEP